MLGAKIVMDRERITPWSQANLKPPVSIKNQKKYASIATIPPTHQTLIRRVTFQELNTNRLYNGIAAFFNLALKVKENPSSQGHQIQHQDRYSVFQCQEIQRVLSDVGRK